MCCSQPLLRHKGGATQLQQELCPTAENFLPRSLQTVCQSLAWIRRASGTFGNKDLASYRDSWKKQKKAGKWSEGGFQHNRINPFISQVVQPASELKSSRITFCACHCLQTRKKGRQSFTKTLWSIFILLYFSLRRPRVMIGFKSYLLILTKCKRLPDMKR